MANATEIAAIELQRLAELEKQRAYHGINTLPEILIEISDLRQKYGQAATAISRDANPAQETREARTIRDLWNEVDFLRALCSSILTRINLDAMNRRPHQAISMAWMGLLTLLLLYALFLR